MTFFDIAKPLAERGIPQIRLRPKTKIAFETNWPKIATTDLSVLQKWSEEMPDANAASVAQAKPGGFWIFEVDRPNLHKEIEQQVGQKMPDTFIVKSSPGRGHFFFRHDPLSIAMGNLQGKDEEGKEAWSARTDSRYVVSANSVHPSTGKVYEVIRNSEIIPAPEWLIQWCIKQKSEPTPEKNIFLEEKKIVSGSRNSTITSLLGRARQTSELNFEELLALGLRLNEERCDPPLSEQEIRTIAGSISKYSITEIPKVLIGGVPVGQLPSTAAAQAHQQQQIQQLLEERPEIKAIPYPVFPDPKWIFKDCSIFDGFVRPVCEANPSRRAEFMMLPALAILLNYLGTKVRIEFKGLIPSIYLVLVARKGRLFKSSSIQDAIEYLFNVGIVDYASQGTRNAEGKSLVWTAGSPEGLGMEMARTNCHSPILFYDELATLSKKTSIEGSSLGQALSTMYESGLFANTVKGRKEQFSHAPKSYCASLLAATTDKNFIQTMSPIITSAQGNDERFMYVYQPEILPKATPQVLVDTKPGSALTRQRVDKAIQKAVYSIDGDMTRLEHLSEINNRVEQRAEKWALALAVDLGRDTIDDDVLERAYYIAKYELAVKKYLHIPESTTREAGIQNEIIQLLQRSGGSVLMRDLNRVMHPERHGTSLWYQVYNGLCRGGWIAEDGEGTKGSPKQVILLRVPEDSDD